MRPAALLIALVPLAASASEAEVAAAAQAALEAAWPAVDAEVRIVRLSGAAEAARPPLRVRFTGEAPPRGRVSAEVEVQGAGGDWERAGWAFLHVARFETAAVLTRDVERGEPLADAVAAARVETTGLSGPPLVPDALRQSGAQAARRLRSGTVLTDRHAEAPAAVERRDALRVLYRRGAVGVALDCQARERGAVGDEVRAVCAGTRSTLRVRLTAPGEGVWTATL